MEDRRNQYKKTYDAQEVRLRGAESQLELRKQQRRQLMNAKRTQTMERLCESMEQKQAQNTQHNQPQPQSKPAVRTLDEKHPVAVLRHLNELRAKVANSSADTSADVEAKAEFDRCLKKLTENGYISELNAFLQSALERSLADDGSDSTSESSTEDPSESRFGGSSSSAVMSANAMNTNSSSTVVVNAASVSSATTVRAALSICNLLAQKHTGPLMQPRGSSKAVQISDVLLSVMNFPVAREARLVRTLLEVLGNICADVDATYRARLLEKNLLPTIRSLLELLCSSSKPSEWSESDAVDIASMALWILRNCVKACRQDAQVVEVVRIFTGMLHLSRDSNTAIVEEAVTGLCEIVEHKEGRFIRSVLIEGQAGELRSHLDAFKENVTVNILTELCSGAHIDRIMRGGSGGSSWESQGSKVSQARQNRAAAFDFVKKVLRKSQLDGAARATASDGATPSFSSSNHSPCASNPLHKQVSQLLLSANLFPAVCTFLKATAQNKFAENSKSVLPDVIDCLNILTLLIGEADKLTEVLPILRQGVFLLLRGVGNKYMHNAKFMVALLSCYARFFLQIEELILNEQQRYASMNWRNLFSMCLDAEGKRNCGEVRANGSAFYATAMNATNVNADFVGVIADFFCFSAHLTSGLVTSNSWLQQSKLLNEVVAVALFVRRSTAFPVMNSHNSTCAMLKDTADLINDNRRLMQQLQESVQSGKIAFPVDSVVFRTGNLSTLNEIAGNGCDSVGGEYLEKGIARSELDRYLKELLRDYLGNAYDTVHSYDEGKVNHRYRTFMPLREMGKPLRHYITMFVDSEEDEEYYLSSCGDQDEHFFVSQTLGDCDDMLDRDAFNAGSSALLSSRGMRSDGSGSTMLQRTVGYNAYSSQSAFNNPSMVANVVAMPNPGCTGMCLTGCPACKTGSDLDKRSGRARSNAMDAGNGYDSPVVAPPRPSEVEAMRRFFCADQVQPFGAGAQQGGFDFS